jgi:hypothetical protein
MLEYFITDSDSDSDSDSGFISSCYDRKYVATGVEVTGSE